MEAEKKHQHLKPKIVVSGAAETGHCGEDAYNRAMELGKEIAVQGAILINGATTGFPFWTAKGAKEAGGVVIGISPAASEREHIEMYKLPIDYLDLVIFTGFGYSGRNFLLTRSADAVIVGCGRIGTINEFTVAFEDGKPLGVLLGAWPTGDVIKNMIEKGNRPYEKLVYNASPKELVSDILKLIEKEKTASYGVYTNSDGFYKECTGPDCKIIL